MPYQGRFTNHSEENLRDAVTSIKQEFPNTGEIMVRAIYELKVLMCKEAEYVQQLGMLILKV